MCKKKPGPKGKKNSDKKLADKSFFFTRQLLLMDIDRIAWQAKIEICKGYGLFFYVHVDKE